MATLKFNYGGTKYELVAKDTKITTPSIKVGNLYIPCFKGNIGEDVTYGDMIYTLSPLKVGKYNAVYKERPNFDGRVYAEINTWGVGLSDTLPVGILRYTGAITNIYTAQPGFTCKLGTPNYQDSGNVALVSPFTFYFNFSSSYQVISNVTNEIVSAGTFTCHVGPIQSAPFGLGTGYKMIFIYDIKNNSVQIKRTGFAPGFDADFIS